MPIQEHELYLKEGLTVLSNHPDVHPRDKNGNIVLIENQENNPYLIIEPNRFNYTTESVVKVVDTRFNFYTFPVSTNIEEIDFDLDTGLDDINFEEADFITSRFTLPVKIDNMGQPDPWIRIGTSYDSNHFYNGEKNQKGYTRLPFETGDKGDEPGCFTLTKDIISYLKRKNKTIRFKIIAQFNSSLIYTYNDPKSQYYNSSTTFNMKLNRLERNEGWTNIFFNRKRQPIVTTEDNDPRYGGYGENLWPMLYMEYILHPTDMWPDYSYYVEVEAGAPSWVNARSTFWEVDIVDIPSNSVEDRPIFGNNDGNTNESYRNYGIYAIGNKSELKNGLDEKIGIQLPNQKFRRYQPLNVQQIISKLNNTFNTLKSKIKAFANNKSESAVYTDEELEKYATTPELNILKRAKIFPNAFIEKRANEVRQAIRSRIDLQNKIQNTDITEDEIFKAASPDELKILMLAKSPDAVSSVKLEAAVIKADIKLRIITAINTKK